MPRWRWDFEEEHREAQAPPGDPPAPRNDGALSARRAQIRRRRAGALAVLAAVAILVIVLVVAGSGHTPHRSASRERVVRPRRPIVRVGGPQAERAAVAHVLSYTPFVKEGSTHSREIALTFDDGPGPYTPALLTVLEHYHVRATFFEIGKMLRYFGQSTEREVRDGDVIGDHTESHPAMAELSAHDQYEELFEQIARVEVLGAPRPVLFRPPYGSFDATTMRELKKLHLLMILWSDDTGDYLLPGVQVIVQRALEGAHPGAIILMHDAGGDRSQTVAALPQIITGLRAKGFRLVTVPQLLEADPPPAGQPLPPNLSGD